MNSQKCIKVRHVYQVKEAIQCKIDAVYICYSLTKLFGDAIRCALFSTTVPTILELYFSLLEGPSQPRLPQWKKSGSGRF